MRILFYQNKPNLNSTMLNWTLAEELRLIGHQVFFLDDIMHINSDTHFGFFDWVRGGGQSSMDAVKFAREFGAKVHIHAEGVAYWRVGKDSAAFWGFDHELSDAEIKICKDQYRSWMKAIYLADTCSINGQNQIDVITEYLFAGKEIPNCYKMSCGVDLRTATGIRSFPEINIMITPSRIAQNKRTLKIAEAVAMVDARIRPHWVIAGYGDISLEKDLRAFLRYNNVSHTIRPMFGAEKWRAIKSSRLMLCGWNGIPPSEGIVCNIPVVSFDHPDIVELYDDTLCYATDNDADSYAAVITNILTGAIKPARLRARNRLYGADLYACTQEQLAKQYDKLFRENM